jgi:hypothetical protein
MFITPGPGRGVTGWFGFPENVPYPERGSPWIKRRISRIIVIKILKKRRALYIHNEVCMNTMNIFRMGVLLLFTGILAVGPVMAATGSDFTRYGGTDLSSLDKSAAISQWTNSGGTRSLLITEIPGSPMADIGKYIQDQKQNPIEWDSNFMSRTLRYAHYVPGCRML